MIPSAAIGRTSTACATIAYAVASDGFTPYPAVNTDCSGKWNVPTYPGDDGMIVARLAADMPSMAPPSPTGIEKPINSSQYTEASDTQPKTVSNSMTSNDGPRPSAA